MEEICGKLSKLVVEHILLVWNPAYGQGCQADELAEVRLWASWAKKLFVFPTVFKETKHTLFANKWDDTKCPPDRYLGSAIEKKNEILQSLTNYNSPGKTLERKKV